MKCQLRHSVQKIGNTINLIVVYNNILEMYHEKRCEDLRRTRVRDG